MYAGLSLVIISYDVIICRGTLIIFSFAIVRFKFLWIKMLKDIFRNMWIWIRKLTYQKCQNLLNKWIFQKKQDYTVYKVFFIKIIRILNLKLIKLDIFAKIDQSQVSSSKYCILLIVSWQGDLWLVFLATHKNSEIQCW